MSLDEIAYLTEMNRTEMTVLERGGGDLQLGTLTRLSAVLKVPVGEFFEGIAWGSLVPEDTMPRRFVVVPARDHHRVGRSRFVEK